MFLVTNRLQIAKGFERELEERFQHRAKLIEREPGFVRMVVLRPIDERPNRETGAREPVAEPGVYQIQTWWKSEDDFWAWTRSESFRKAHAEKPNPAMYRGPAALEMHEVAIDSSGA